MPLFFVVIYKWYTQTLTNNVDTYALILKEISKQKQKIPQTTCLWDFLIFRIA